MPAIATSWSPRKGPDTIAHLGPPGPMVRVTIGGRRLIGEDVAADRPRRDARRMNLPTCQPLALLVLSASVACTGTPPGSGGDADLPPDDGRVTSDGGPDPDGGPSELGVYESGSRLKMRVGTSPDGAKTFLGWRDTMRNEDCAFGVAADGQQRCLPASSGSYLENVFWGDSGCTTTRLAYLQVGCVAATGYVHHYLTSCSPYQVRVHMLGARHAGTVYVRSGASCTVSTATFDFYRLGPEVPAGSFVGVTESLE